MINYDRKYTITSSYINVSRDISLSSNEVETYTYNISNYDDTGVKNRLSLLETEVTDLQREDEGFNHRLSLLESHEGDYATKEELNSIEGRVTNLETTPVGITNSQMDEILND